MILSNHYHEVMEHIELTPEMRARILEHVQQADLSPDQAAKEPKKVTKFANLHKYAGMAAGLVVLIAVCAVLPNVLTKNGDQNQTPEEDTQVTWDHQEYDSAQAQPEEVWMQLLETNIISDEKNRQNQKKSERNQ